MKRLSDAYDITSALKERADRRTFTTAEVVKMTGFNSMLVSAVLCNEVHAGRATKKRVAGRGRPNEYALLDSFYEHEHEATVKPRPHGRAVHTKAALPEEAMPPKLESERRPMRLLLDDMTELMVKIESRFNELEQQNAETALRGVPEMDLWREIRRRRGDDASLRHPKEVERVPKRR